MTSRRKFLTTSGILAGMAATGKAEIPQPEAKGRKPILVLTFPIPSICESFEYEKSIRDQERKAIEKLQETLKDDYYLLVIEDSEIKSIKYEILSEANTKREDIEKIMAIIKEVTQCPT